MMFSGTAVCIRAYPVDVIPVLIPVIPLVCRSIVKNAIILFCNNLISSEAPAIYIPWTSVAALPV